MTSSESAQEAEDLLAVLKLIAERAGKEILAYYVEGEDGPAVREKADSTPVTEADEAAEAFILEALAKLTPDIPVVSEEAAAAGHLPDVSGGRFWLVDPLDGTREFLSRNGEFTVNIGLIEDGRPVAGVVHAPALAMTWAGAQPGAGLEAAGETGGPAVASFSETDKETLAIRVRELPAEGATVVASRRHGSGDLLDDFLKDYTVKDLVSAGSSLKFCLVASGRADLYPRFGRTMEWDTAAGHAVLLAAGGSVETVAGGSVATTPGRPLTYGKPGFENPFFVARGAADPAGG
ncbi:MAG: 3'(2'),5'-bisphosphate nucleotidase CysQ [Kiloniellales bacterium]|nr:3'(2'),5'-bisphosphate nucleotidase CysQ [Kiloniellales bacterium]